MTKKQQVKYLLQWYEDNCDMVQMSGHTLLEHMILSVAMTKEGRAELARIIAVHQADEAASEFDLARVNDKPKKPKKK